MYIITFLWQIIGICVNFNFIKITYDLIPINLRIHNIYNINNSNIIKLICIYCN